MRRTRAYFRTATENSTARTENGQRVIFPLILQDVELAIEGTRCECPDAWPATFELTRPAGCGSFPRMAPLSKISSLVLASVAAASAAGVDFQRDIQPLFAEHCYECHGPDAQKGGLSMTTREGAMKVLESGVAAFVPGHPEKSEALSRLTTNG